MEKQMLKRLPILLMLALVAVYSSPLLANAKQRAVDNDVAQEILLAAMSQQQLTEHREKDAPPDPMPGINKGTSSKEQSCEELQKRLELINLQIDLLNDELSDPSLSPQERKLIQNRIGRLRKLAVQTEKALREKAC